MENRKLFNLFMVICLSLVFMLTSCGTNNDDNTVTFKDCSGATVTISKEINNVIVTDQSCNAFLTAMGETEKIYGVHKSIFIDKWTPIFMGEHHSKLKKYGYNPSAEAIYEAGVDLVIISDQSHAEELRKAGVPAVCFAYSNLDELFFAVDMLGIIFGEKATTFANSWKSYVSNTINSLKEQLASVKDKKNVYYINASNNPTDLYSTFGGGSFYEFWINTIGANLVTSDYPGITSIETEVILAKNPETIIIGGYAEYTRKDELLADPLWTDIDAVKNNDILLLPASLARYEKFSVEFPLLLTYSAHAFYPDLVPFDGINTLRTFYHNIYNLDLSDTYLTNLLLGLYPDGSRADA